MRFIILLFLVLVSCQSTNSIFRDTRFILNEKWYSGEVYDIKYKTSKTYIHTAMDMRNKENGYIFVLDNYVNLSLKDSIFIRFEWGEPVLLYLNQEPKKYWIDSFEQWYK